MWRRGGPHRQRRRSGRLDVERGIAAARRLEDERGQRPLAHHRGERYAGDAHNAFAIDLVAPAEERLAGSQVHHGVVVHDVDRVGAEAGLRRHEVQLDGGGATGRHNGGVDRQDVAVRWRARGCRRRALARYGCGQREESGWR
jgi:hypothetical protein